MCNKNKTDSGVIPRVVCGASASCGAGVACVVVQCVALCCDVMVVVVSRALWRMTSATNKMKSVVCDVTGRKSDIARNSGASLPYPDVGQRRRRPTMDAAKQRLPSKTLSPPDWLTDVRSSRLYNTHRGLVTVACLEYRTLELFPAWSVVPSPVPSHSCII